MHSILQEKAMGILPNL